MSAFQPLPPLLWLPRPTCLPASRSGAPFLCTLGCWRAGLNLPPPRLRAEGQSRRAVLCTHLVWALGVCVQRLPLSLAGLETLPPWSLSLSPSLSPCLISGRSWSLSPVSHVGLGGEGVGGWPPGVGGARSSSSQRGLFAGDSWSIQSNNHPIQTPRLTDGFFFPLLNLLSFLTELAIQQRLCPHTPTPPRANR